MSVGGSTHLNQQGVIIVASQVTPPTLNISGPFANMAPACERDLAIKQRDAAQLAAVQAEARCEELQQLVDARNAEIDTLRATLATYLQAAAMPAPAPAAVDARAAMDDALGRALRFSR